MTIQLNPSVSVQLTPAIKERLERISEATHQPVSYVINSLIENNLDELEDAQEIQATAQAIREGKIKTYSLTEARAELGL